MPLSTKSSSGKSSKPAANNKGTSNKTGKPPPIDKLIIPAIGIGLALLAYQFFKGLKSEIPRINVHDELEMRDVFFGEGNTGKSYAVLCHEEDSKTPISSVFQDAFNDGTAPAEFRLLDCRYILPASEKTVIDRFQLNTKIRPTIFISGAAGAPQQVPEKHLKTGAMLVKALKAKLEKRAANIETTQDLRNKCLEREVCALLLKGSKKASTSLKNALTKLMNEFPDVPFAAMDDTVLYAKNLEEYLPEQLLGQGRFVIFSKVSGSTKVEENAGGRLITSIAPLQSTNGANYADMKRLLSSVLNQSATLSRLPVLPMIKTRTKKLEQEELDKRERKKQQQTRQQQQQQQQESTSSSTFPTSSTANDGSRDGRRAERDRRRAEHHATHHVKPKTAEEMAEMERQRRKRMEEEAAKWNIRPDDAPEEGDVVTDDTGEYYDILNDQDDDDNNNNSNQDDGSSASGGSSTDFDGDEEGDDVIDLD